MAGLLGKGFTNGLYYVDLIPYSVTDFSDYYFSFVFLSHLIIMPRPLGALRDIAIRPSVCPSVCPMAQLP